MKPFFKDLDKKFISPIAANFLIWTAGRSEGSLKVP